jgi:anthranilate phosphoribosyltransferase
MERFGSVLENLVAGRPLSSSESHDAVLAMLLGNVPEARAAAFLTALRMKGETAGELEGAVTAIRERMIPFAGNSLPELLLDTCGTGGDRAGSVNISTAAAIVVAGCGVAVVKHGNRAASSSSGSSDVLLALGVAIDPELPLLFRSLSELNIAFLFAPRFHPGLGNLATIRRLLPFRTMFNLVGPLCNPASPSHQVVGTPDGPHADLLADVLSRLPSIRRAAVVSATDGLDEVTLGGPTKVRLVEDGMVRQLVWHPADFGLSSSSAQALRVRGPLESAQQIRNAVSGEPGPVRDYIVANSAAALWITGRYALREGAELAATAINSGAAALVLERWRQLVPAVTPSA